MAWAATASSSVGVASPCGAWYPRATAIYMHQVPNPVYWHVVPGQHSAFDVHRLLLARQQVPPAHWSPAMHGTWAEHACPRPAWQTPATQAGAVDGHTLPHVPQFVASV